MKATSGARVPVRSWTENLRTLCKQRRNSVLLCLFILTLAVVASTTFIWLSRQEEPQFAGKPVSVWLVEASSTNSVVRSRAESVLKESRERALPILIRIIRSRSILEPRSYWRLENSLPFRVLRYLPSPWLLQDKQKKACAALALMGPGAHSAIPALAECLTKQDGEIASAACQALAAIGSEAVPILSWALTNSTTPYTYPVAIALRELGTNALPALPALREAMRSGDSSTLFTVIQILGRLGRAGVPLLAERLTNPIAPFRKETIETLGMMGTNAEPALPALKSLAQDPDYPWNVLAWRACEAIETGKPMRR